MRIVMTGATGFVGRRLFVALTRQGHDLVVLTRSPEKARDRLPSPCEMHAWDGFRENAPAAALRDADAVIHLAGEGVALHRWTAAQKKKIHDSRVLGTRGLMATLSELSRRPAHFIAASAIGFYGSRADETLTEESSRGTGFLADVCVDWESEIVRAAELGMREVRIRIGVVLGVEGGALAKLLPVFRAGLGGPVGNGRQWMSWIHADDLVSLFVHALENTSLCGVANGVGPAPVTNREFSVCLGKAMRKPCFVPAPAFALRLAMGEMAGLVLDSQRVLPERALKAGFSFAYSSLGPALADICAGR